MRSRNLLTILLCLFLALPALAFEDDFEDGLGNWTGNWQLTTEQNHSATHSITDSPGTDYSPNTTYSIAMSTGEDLTDAFGAELTYWVRTDTEEDFDYWYVDVSTDGGDTWTNLYVESGQDLTWREMSIDLGGYVGNDDVRIRYRLISDGGVEEDGLWIDDVAITSSDVDESPPLVVHTPVAEDEGITGSHEATFTITDVSGVGDVSLAYTADDDDEVEVADYTQDGDEYTFTIPGFSAGTHVAYTITASDEADPENEGEYGSWEYYCGTILCYDDLEVDYINSPSADYSYATRFTTEEALYLAGLQLRFYIDPSHGLDTVDVKVWEDNGGSPGDEIHEVAKYPDNEAGQPYRLTFVDLRNAMIEVDGDFHAGYTHRSSLPVIGYTSPAVANRSKQNMSGTWTAFSGDLHIRAIVGQLEPEDVTCEQLQTDSTLAGAYVRTRGIVTLAPNSIYTTRTEAWLQDTTGYAVKLFSLQPTAGVVRGDEIEVVGTVNEFMGTTRIEEFTLEVLSNDNPLPEPITGTTAEIAAMTAMEGSWAEITGILQEQPPDEPGNFELTVDDGSGACAARFHAVAALDLSEYDQYDGITIRGPLWYDNGVCQVAPSTDDDLEPADGLDMPTDFTGAITDSISGEVELSWVYGALDEYLYVNVYRDDELLASVEEAAYTDTLPDLGEYVYTVRAAYDEGLSDPADPVTINWEGSGVTEGVFAGIPDEFGISALYPNPFNSTVNVVIGVPDAMGVQAQVFDLLGRSVATIHSGRLTPGYHRFVWRAEGLPTGVYFVRSTASTGEKVIRKVTFIK